MTAVAAASASEFPEHTVEEYVHVMMSYKVNKCTEPGCAKGWGCFGWHTLTERRRAPTYRLGDKAKKCPDMVTIQGVPQCPRGDACPHFHTMA
jgi:hypothetical protein